VIHEVSNASSHAAGNWIELRNLSNAPIDVSGWYLSDTESPIRKFILPFGSVIPAGEYLVLSEQDHFGNPAGGQPFALNAAGGELYLRSSDQLGQLTGYQESRRFGAAEPDLTQGLTETSDGYSFTVLQTATRGEANAAPVIGPIVIHEIMYHAAAGGTDFVELKNLTDQTIQLNDAAGNAWSFTQGIQFAFPTGATLAPQGYALLIEQTDQQGPEAAAAAFRADYGVPANVPIFVYNANDHGVLDNGGENLELSRPSRSHAGDDVPVDRVKYDDNAPWPLVADGEGPSLSKLVADQFSDDPQHWAAGRVQGTPGRDNLYLDTTPPTEPQALRGKILAGNQIALAWLPSEDPQSGIGHYNVYRNNELLQTTPIPWVTTTMTFDEVTLLNFEVAAVNGDGAESRRSVVWSIGPDSDTYQAGANGYTGAADAEMREGNPDSNNGTTDQSLEVDGEDGGTELAVLLRWRDLTIPADRQVVGASFQVVITNNGNQYKVERVLRSWSESQVTWNQAANGSAWQTPGAKGNADHGEIVAQFNSNSTEFNEAGVVMVQSWIDDPASNHGILISNPGGATDGVDFQSREVSTVSERPALTILHMPLATPLEPGDFTLDGVVDADDITAMSLAIAAGAPDAVFDLNRDGEPANAGDWEQLIQGILNTTYGDANLDGIFNSADFVEVFIVGEYEDSIDHNSTWKEGDWNGDRDFDSSDFVVAFQTGLYEVNPQAARTNMSELAAAADWLFSQGDRSSRSRAYVA
jgi:hypothetical protein